VKPSSSGEEPKKPAASGKQQPPRPPARQNKAGKRNMKIEVKLSEAEERIVRKIFGRMAAAAARSFWLGFQVDAPLTPSKKATLECALALHTYHVAVAELRRRIKSSLGEEADALGAAEEQLFQSLTNTWLSNFSGPQK